MSRVELDQYPTKPWMTQALLAEVPRIAGRILEPCSGAGWITHVLREHPGVTQVQTNDIDVKYGAEGAFDVTKPHLWTLGPWDWVVTNPPFNVAFPIVQRAVENAYFGVAMLLRRTWDEPTKGRAQWLAEHPPTGEIVLPRDSFRQNGATDNVTCAWFLWEKDGIKTGIRIVPTKAPQTKLLEVI